MKPVIKDFIGKQAPSGYVAGIGRGATGFTTRSDIGPAREFQNKLDNDKPKRFKKDDSDEEDLNDNNYDDFSGYNSSLFSKDTYEQEDEEADLIYESIDKHMDERGKAHRESKSQKELERYRQEKPKIHQQFSDAKQELAMISEEDWMNIPEVGDARNRKQRVTRAEKMTPVPDSLLAYQAKLAAGGERNVYIDFMTGIETPLVPSTSGTATSALGQMGEIRSTYMSMKLNQISDNVGGQTNVNPQGYLTELKALNMLQMNDTATIKNSEKMYKAIIASNPNHPLAWIGLARLEEKAGKIKKARSVLLSGCEKCPKHVNLWIEAARMHPRDEAKAILVKAIEERPDSVDLWIKAADFEQDEDGKRKVYAKSLEAIPSSPILWQKAVDLAKSPEEAKKLLRDAVSNCPQCVDLWVSLAKLEDYEEAKSVLNQARERNPSDKKIWIAAAKLEETFGKPKMVGKILRRGLSDLKAQGIVIGWDEWRREAIEVDLGNYKLTCKEIVKQVFGQRQEEDSQVLDSALECATLFTKSNAFECARAIYEFVTKPLSSDSNDDAGDLELNNQTSKCRDESVWQSYADFERLHGSKESVESVLRLAVRPQNCIKSVSLWLQLAREHWTQIDEARCILSNALDANPDSEQIIIAAVQLECNNKNFDEARRILADACKSAKTAQLLTEWAKMEWELDELDRASKLLEEGIDEFKNFPQFFLMFGQLEEQRKQNRAAKKHYSTGLQYNQTCSDLWIAMAKLEEKMGSIALARSLLERSRLRNPREAKLWLEAARLELRANRRDMASSLLAKAVRECRTSPDLHLLQAEQELLAPKFKRPRVQFKQQ